MSSPDRLQVYDSKKQFSIYLPHKEQNVRYKEFVVSSTQVAALLYFLSLGITDFSFLEEQLRDKILRANTVGPQHVSPDKFIAEVEKTAGMQRALWTGKGRDLTTKKLVTIPPRALIDLREKYRRFQIGTLIDDVRSKEYNPTDFIYHGQIAESESISPLHVLSKRDSKEVFLGQWKVRGFRMESMTEEKLHSVIHAIVDTSPGARGALRPLIEKQMQQE